MMDVVTHTNHHEIHKFYEPDNVHNDNHPPNVIQTGTTIIDPHHAGFSAMQYESLKQNANDVIRALGTVR